MTTLSKTRKKCLLAALLLFMPLIALAFKGSELTSGQKYYLYNIYQSKFLGANNKLQAPNIGSPISFTATSTGFTICGTSYIAAKNDAGYYQLKYNGNFYAFEDKVADPNNPDDENRAMYTGGGVTCQNTTNDTDRSYWQLISENEYNEWTEKKKVTIASLNVDGMPSSVKVYGIYNVDLNPDATEGPGATKIGNKLRESGFDVVGVSEDFNFHSELWSAAWNNGEGVHYNATTHRGEINASAAGILTKYLNKEPIADIDGLCLFYRVGIPNQTTLESSEAWTQWNEHNGYTDSGADGLIKKGYRFYVVKLADGTEIDLYTMHMDADSNPEDCEARASQLTQLVNAIKASNNGRPIVIIGDSNCRYTRDKVKTNLIDALNADERFTCRDPWIEFGRNSKYPVYPSASIMASTNGYLAGEVVDKIWYVNNKQSDIRLVAETYAQDLSFVDETGSPLCDHKPCVVTFSYHTYDATIDDQPVEETVEEVVYLRNRETGRFLMNGGWWGSHAVVGNYAKPYYIKSLPDGKYDLTSNYGYVNDDAYVDGAENTRQEFTIIEKSGFSIFSYELNGVQKALTANDPTYFNDNPLYRYVTTATLNANDKYQQWEIVTQKQLDAEMAKATSLNPFNATHLIKSANFDRIDWNEHGSWKFDYKDNNTNDRVVDNGIGGADNDAFCNFNRSVNTKKAGTFNSSSNQWDCYQVLSVPEGYYVITNQGFEKGTQCTYLYAWSNPEGSYVEKTARLATYNSDLTSEDQTGAGHAFDEGKYKNVLPVLKVGQDGVLVIGVKKTENNSTSGWTVFDNFQLYYLGKNNPGKDYKYDVISETRSASYENGVTTLTGTWRATDMAELKTNIIANKPLVINASTSNYIIGCPEISEMPANAVIKVNDATDVANTNNVIDASGTCSNFVLTDKENFNPQQQFIATNVSYSRSNTQGYNTVCLPFAVKASDFPDCLVYTYTRTNETTITFTEATEDEINAGTPLLIYSQSSNNWQMNLVNLTIIPATTAEANGLNGSFVKKTLGEGYFKLNSAGEKFVKTTTNSTITPFRFYFKPEQNDVASYTLSFGDNEETSIQALMANPDTKVEQSYDLSGRRIISITRPGIYIKDGHKVLKR